MRRLALIALATMAASAAWAALVLLATLSGWGRPTLAPRGDLPTFWKAAVEVLEKNSNGNVAFALIREGEVYGEHFHSKGGP